MKIQIVYTEIQYLKNTIEVEMTKKEYKEYLKKSLQQQEQQFDFTANTSVDSGHHYSTEIVSIEAEILN